MTDLDNASAEIIEMRAISDLRAKSGRPLPETVMPSERLHGGTDENASLVVHINSINKSTSGGLDATSSSSSSSTGGDAEKKSRLVQVRWLIRRVRNNQDQIRLQYFGGAYSK